MRIILIVAPLVALAAYFILLLRRNQLTFSDLWDMLSNRQEYKTSGQGGERFLYRELIRLGVPESQIFRNVYIPVHDKTNKTSEIDLLVLSKKGILVFEHKTYQGKIYGDGRSKKWTQCYHGKHAFLSPVEQNRYHAECLRRFLDVKLPIYTFITHSVFGEWHIRNIPSEAHFITKKGDFSRIYQNIPDSPAMARAFQSLSEKLSPLSRPEDGTREQHIVNFGK